MPPDQRTGRRLLVLESAALGRPHLRHLVPLTDDGPALDLHYLPTAPTAAPEAYTQIHSSTLAPVPDTAVVCQLHVALTSTDPGGLLDWYRGEHIPLLLRNPGWLAVRQYRRLRGPGEELLTVHDLTHPGATDHPAWRAATTTAWRERALRDVVRRTRRLYLC
ncbi:hypothetical protein AB0O01_02070 [Streptomyces sp. NPDC093252]|uniref:hypothetical protein n=1 Tax=Streptomyces sp. NPDC093252 TaxID=3154980 RepID=UPI00342871F2